MISLSKDDWFVVSDALFMLRMGGRPNKLFEERILLLEKKIKAKVKRK